MGKAQLFLQPLLERRRALVFSSATVESFGAKSLHLTGSPLNFHFLLHSAPPGLVWISWSWPELGIALLCTTSSERLLWIIYTSPKQIVNPLHRMEGSKRAIGWSGWAQGTRSHPQNCWAPGSSEATGVTHSVVGFLTVMCYVSLVLMMANC